MKNKLFALVTLLLAACSSQNYTTSPDSLTTNPNTGIAVGTITFEGDIPVNDLYRFFYSPISGDKKFKKHNDGKILINGRNDGKSAFNGDFNDKKTYLIVIEGKPGTYAFTKYNYLDHIGSNGMISNSKDFEIPFEVKKGGITYIGEFTYVDKAEPGSPRIYVTDRMERDIKEFEKKYPDLDWDKVINSTPKSGKDGGGIISFM
ncbi:hypothetical protein [Flavobacterium rhizosphaerae]|uniref:Lipoprotein n=1 Tax=Flavobacterium rhizosphaerae TaxID=3163298 RepID=A0ABW8YWU2_9FLAO